MIYGMCMCLCLTRSTPTPQMGTFGLLPRSQLPAPQPPCDLSGPRAGPAACLLLHLLGTLSPGIRLPLSLTSSGLCSSVTLSGKLPVPSTGKPSPLALL